MEKEFCTVQTGDKVKCYERGIAYKKIAEEFQEEYPAKIVLALVDGTRLQELNKRLKQDCKIEFVTVKDPIGYETYRRSLCFMLVKAVHDVGGHDKIRNVKIHFSVSNGYYCTIDGDVVLDQKFLDQIDARMHELAEAQIPIEKRSVHTSDAVELFGRHGMYDKERLFGYRRVSKVNIYRMNEFEDYYYGYMVPDSGYLKNFALHLYDEGFVLQMPFRKEPDVVPAFEPREKLFQVLKSSVQWGDLQNIETVGALNDMVTRSYLCRRLIRNGRSHRSPRRLPRSRKQSW